MPELKLTQADLDAVAGMPSRMAAEILGCGKSTVNKARELARQNGGRLPADDGTTSAVVTGSAVPQNAEEVEQLLSAMGIDRERHSVSLGFSVFDQGDATKRALRVTTKDKPVDVAEVRESIDPIAVLNALRLASDGQQGSPLPVVETWEESAFVLSINDIQLGQSYNGGSKATIEQFYRLIAGAKDRIKELHNMGRNFTKLVIIGGGDLVEGCVIYGNQAFSLDMDRKQQVEGVVALLLHALDTLAPMFDRVIVLASKGNHGEHRIDGKYTTLSDNDDTHVWEMAKLALSRDETMQHIEWTIAESEAGVAVRVFDWVLATTHGDIYAKGVQGATIDKKAHNWMKNMALGRERFGLLGQADVLITHHFHHNKMSDWGSCLWRQTPSQDRGSPYFEQATGEYSDPGMLTFVMTESNRYQDEHVVR